MPEKVVREFNEADFNKREAYIDLRGAYEKFYSVIGDTILSCDFLSDVDKRKVGQKLDDAVEKEFSFYGVETNELAKLDEDLKCFIFDPDFDEIKMLIFER